MRERAGALVLLAIGIALGAANLSEVEQLHLHHRPLLGRDRGCEEEHAHRRCQRQYTGTAGRGRKRPGRRLLGVRGPPRTRRGRP
ncbi:hypothetical protein CG719_25910 [Streptomyces sp. CB01373]|nr:hypothetical protein CG719_25910 [Streptomyces sp. CB01373]